MVGILQSSPVWLFAPSLKVRTLNASLRFASEPYSQVLRQAGQLLAPCCCVRYGANILVPFKCQASPRYVRARSFNVRKVTSAGPHPPRLTFLRKLRKVSGSLTLRPSLAEGCLSSVTLLRIM